MLSPYHTLQLTPRALLLTGPAPDRVGGQAADQREGQERGSSCIIRVNPKSITDPSRFLLSITGATPDRV